MGTPLPDNIRKRAQALRLTHSEVARRAGLHERRFANYVLGRREPDLQSLLLISKALHTTPNELLGVGVTQPEDERDLLRSRIVAAMDQLDESDQQVAVRQVEILAELKGKLAR